LSGGQVALMPALLDLEPMAAWCDGRLEAGDPTPKAADLLLTHEVARRVTVTRW